MPAVAGRTASTRRTDRFIRVALSLRPRLSKSARPCWTWLHATSAPPALLHYVGRGHEIAICVLAMVSCICPWRHIIWRHHLAKHVEEPMRVSSHRRVHASGHTRRALQFRDVLPTVHCKELVCHLRHGQFLQRKCVILLGQCCTVAKIASCHWAGSEVTKDLKVVSSVGYSEDWPVAFCSKSSQHTSMEHVIRKSPQQFLCEGQMNRSVSDRTVIGQ